MSTESYGKSNVFFKYFQELSPLWTGKTFPCCIYRDVCRCPRSLPGRWPCACYKALPCTNVGFSMASHKSRDRGEGQENHPSPGVQLCLLEWGFALNFSIAAWVPLTQFNIFRRGTFWKFISKHRNSRQFLFWTDQRKQQKYFWNLLAGLQGHLFSLIYLADPFNYFLSPRCLPGWARVAARTMFTVAVEILMSYSTAHLFSWSHSHKGNSIVQDNLGFFYHSVEIVVNTKYTTMPLSSQISCAGVLPDCNKSGLWMVVTFPFLAHVSSLPPAWCTGWSRFV